MLQTGILAATLAPSLKSLHDLWIEYDCGIGGTKLFTPSERGQVKFVYSRRNVAWKMIRNVVVDGGKTSDLFIPFILYMDMAAP